MVEQRLTEKAQQEPVQSINSRKMEVEPKQQGVVARFYNTPMKRRKNSV
jgi:hypothetical protein